MYSCIRFRTGLNSARPLSLLTDTAVVFWSQSLSLSISACLSVSQRLLLVLCLHLHSQLLTCMQENRGNVYIVHTRLSVWMCVSVWMRKAERHQWIDSMLMNGYVVKILSAAPVKPVNHENNWLFTVSYTITTYAAKRNLHWSCLVWFTWLCRKSWRHRLCPAVLPQRVRCQYCNGEFHVNTGLRTTPMYPSAWKKACWNRTETGVLCSLECALFRGLWVVRV